MVMARDFPVVAGNHFELLVDGEACGCAILEAIGQARHYVLAEHYLVESGHFASAFFDALCDAAERGVRVYLILDHFGCLNLNGTDRERLARYPIHLIWYNRLQFSKWLSNFHRDHRKFILVDQDVAFIGGFCITDHFWRGPGSPELEHGARLPWLDVAVMIRGPVLAQWRELFMHTWHKLSGEVIDLPPLSSALAGHMWGRAAWAAGHLHQGILREFLARARKAQGRIYIATPYFVPSWRIRRMLIRAAKRGVDVRLLLPGPETDHPPVRFAAWRYYKRLLQHGVRIFEYQPRFIHAKVILCDHWASIGSCNLDHWNQRWNLEANQEIEDERFAETVLDFFNKSLQESEEQRLATWLRPYWWRRLLSSFWGRIDSWLTRL